MNNTREWDMYFDSIDGTLLITTWGREISDHGYCFIVVVERQEVSIANELTNGPPERPHPCGKLVGKTVAVTLAKRLIYVFDDGHSAVWEDGEQD